MTGDEKIGEIVDLITSYVIDLDPSPKMVLHEPYRSIKRRIEHEFKAELIAYYESKR